MPKPTNPARNAELAAIHIAKAEAGMADDSYSGDGSNWEADEEYRCNYKLLPLDPQPPT